MAWQRWTLALLLWLSPWGVAQEAQALLAEAERLAEAARSAYAGSVFTIDQPLWRESLTAAEAALELAPDDPVIIAFLAQTYGEINWHSRAWHYWQRYLALGAPLSAAQADAVSRVGSALGFTRYDAGDLEGARRYYQAVLEVLPESREALRWLGRIALEQDDPQAALGYWQQLVALEPDDASAAYYLALTEEQLRVGLEASRAFRAGLQRYEAQELAAALSYFEAAARANAEFAEAFAWAGRTALELGEPARALPFWQRAAELEPDDGRARYFIALSEAQLAWGVEAGRAFFAGQEAYERGDVAAAAAAFEQAAAHNPAYLEAWVWAARSRQEQGEAEQAAAHWRRVLALEPDDARARYFLRLAEQGLGLADEGLLARGIASFELAQFDEAAALFEAATAAEPELAEAWGWLGRVYFTLARYAEAAEAYARALALEPENDDYRFFAEEASYLAEREP